MRWAKVDGRVQAVDVLGHVDVSRYRAKKMQDDLGLPERPRAGRYYDCRLLGKLKTGSPKGASVGTRLIHEEDMR